MTRTLIAAVVLSAIAAAPLVGREGSRLSTSKPLSAILEAVAKAGYTDVTEVSYDDGQWEVEVLKDGRPVGLRIDPLSAKILRDHPDEPHPRIPQGAKPLTAIVAQLEKDGYSPIEKAELELAGWEVEALHNGQWRELIIDLDGKIISDQLDD